MTSNYKGNLEITGLSPQQQRMLRRLNCVLIELSSADSEEEFFSFSTEAMQLCAAIIKQSTLRSNASNGYREQALELALDTIMEQLRNSTIVSFDN